jgi:hypothetical protein
MPGRPGRLLTGKASSSGAPATTLAPAGEAPANTRKAT